MHLHCRRSYAHLERLSGFTHSNGSVILQAYEGFCLFYTHYVLCHFYVILFWFQLCLFLFFCFFLSPSFFLFFPPSLSLSLSLPPCLSPLPLSLSLPLSPPISPL